MLKHTLQHHIQRLLTGSEGGGRGGRLVDDALRLWARVQRLLGMKLLDQPVHLEALELACFGLQLPLRQGKTPAAGRMGAVSLRERAEQAAELLISAVEDHAEPELLERAGRILRELPERRTTVPEARILADAVNLDDFGVTGLVIQAIQLARQNAGVGQVADGFEKRREYGYWDARLKDGFHFAAVREMARKRLGNAEAAAEMLARELKEDQTP